MFGFSSVCQFHDGCGVEGQRSLPLLCRIKHDRRHFAVKALFHSCPRHSAPVIAAISVRAEPISWQQRPLVSSSARRASLVFHRVTFMADTAPVRCPSPFNYCPYQNNTNNRLILFSSMRAFVLSFSSLSSPSSILTPSGRLQLLLPLHRPPGHQMH